MPTDKEKIDTLVAALEAAMPALRASEQLQIIPDYRTGWRSEEKEHLRKIIDNFSDAARVALELAR